MNTNNVATNGMTTNDSGRNLAGLWQPRLNLTHLYYGPGCVQQHLQGVLPSSSSKAVIITGNSLASKTPLVQQLESLLGQHHVQTISSIRQHGPAEDVLQAIEIVMALGEDVDTIISLGGGSPIDTAKVISLRVSEKRGTFLNHIAIPTTLSAAECTAGGGYTKPNGVKFGCRVSGMGVSTIFYDALYAKYTPRQLWLSSGMRAMDHAVECMYHPNAVEMPWKTLSLWTVSELFECLPRMLDPHQNDEVVMTRLMLAAFASSGLKGENIQGGMGLSHSLGHALGSPYCIPHGITSCMTLAKVVALKIEESVANAEEIARLLPAAGGARTGDDPKDAREVVDRIEALVRSLHIGNGSLSSYGVPVSDAPLIAERALGGVQEGPWYERVLVLVQSMF
ncbi:hypothetical protein LTR86_009864 [Recurvomyces mirabilis]|nr:hypothetical protein LTR86_009864 [Recurvomyces mirabilis]